MEGLITESIQGKLGSNLSQSTWEGGVVLQCQRGYVDQGGGIDAEPAKGVAVH